MSFRNEQASDQPISADSTAATKADLKSPADCLSAGGGQLSDLQWQAFRYLTDELEAEEIAAFEKLLQESAAAGEALVAMVSLLEFLGQQSLGNEHCGQEPASRLKQSALVPRQAGGSLTPTGEITHLECGKTSHGSPAGGQRSWAWLAVAAVLSGVSLFGWWQLGSESRRDLAVAKSPDPSDPLGLATEWAEVWAGPFCLSGKDSPVKTNGCWWKIVEPGLGTLKSISLGRPLSHSNPGRSRLRTPVRRYR